MAVDSRSKRQSMIGLGLGPGIVHVLFDADTSGVVAAERASFLHLYYGITLDEIQITTLAEYIRGGVASGGAIRGGSVESGGLRGGSVE